MASIERLRISNSLQQKGESEIDVMSGIKHQKDRPGSCYVRR